MAADDSSIHNCHFSGAQEFDVLVSQGTGTGWVYNVSVTDNIFTGSKGDGVHIGAAINVVVDGNVLHNTGDDSIGVICDDVGYNPNRINVTNNVIYNSGTGGSGCGIQVNEANDVLVSGNNIYSTEENAITVGRFNSTTAFNNRIKITNNKIIDSTANSGPRAAIWMEFVSELDCSNNVISDTNHGAGICFCDVNDATISLNQIRNSPSRGIVSDDSSTTNVRTTWNGIRIFGNTLFWVVANEAIYVKPGAGITITELCIDGNYGKTVGAGNWIYYDQVTTGRVCNNVTTSAATIAAGGTVSGVTLANNN
jgi:hypothetical protein